MKKLWRRVICRSASSFDVPPTTTNHLTLAEGKSAVITDNIILMRNNEVEDPSSFRLELQHRRRSKSESYLPTSDDCVDGHTEYGHVTELTIYPVFLFSILHLTENQKRNVVGTPFLVILSWVDELFFFFFFLFDSYSFLFSFFSSAALRDLWWNRLGQAVKDERDKEPKTTTIQITYHDAVQAIGYVSNTKEDISSFFFYCCGLFIKWIGPCLVCWLCSALLWTCSVEHVKSH